MSNMLMTADAVTTCETSCMYNTTIDMFVSNSKIPSGTTGIEIMINLDHTWNNDSVLLGTATFDGVTYKVFHQSFSAGWETIVYEAPTTAPVSQIKIDARDVVNDAVNRGFIKSTDYLVSIELGAEVVNGKGTTTIKNFKIN